MTLTCHYCKQMDTFDESSFWFETFFGSFEFLMAFYVQKLEYLLPFILLILYPYSLGVELEIQRLLMYWCKSCISIKYSSKKRVKCKKNQIHSYELRSEYISVSPLPTEMMYHSKRWMIRQNSSQTELNSVRMAGTKVTSFKMLQSP